ncbi:MAG TPA: hypothetical protein DCL86_19665 [Bacteroidales bacterium]|jgi:hypothetical protein|nr:hypothetical protein [Bacteroidales bacterium]
MLEYSKTILQKVSFSRELFRKELFKSLTGLKNEEAVVLQVWCLLMFKDQYSDIIRDAFSYLA